MMASRVPLKLCRQTAKLAAVLTGLQTGELAERRPAGFAPSRQHRHNWCQQKSRKHCVCGYGREFQQAAKPVLPKK